MKEQEFELIERYLLGELQSNELDVFEARMTKEPQLKANVQEVRDIITAAKRAEIQDRIAKARQEDLLERREAKVTKLSSRRVMSIAAGFLLLAVVGFGVTQQWWSQRPSQLASAFFEPAVGLPTTLGISDDSRFIEGMIDYKLGDFPEAIARWEKLRATDVPSDTLSYYLGVALLANNQPSQALGSFKELSSGSQLWSNSQWYTAIAYVQLEEIEKAKPILEKLSQQSGPNRNQAAALLSKL